MAQFTDEERVEAGKDLMNLAGEANGVALAIQHRIRRPVLNVGDVITLRDRLNYILQQVIEDIGD